MKEIFITGINCTGEPHLGNYVGAIRPGIDASYQDDKECYFFMADMHALIKCQNPQLVSTSSRAIAASWLALGLNYNKAVFYRQSDVPEISELSWILNCVTSKGLMNRAHAYKAVVEENLSNNQDGDAAVTMGLYSYPVLMTADILILNANKVPVGKDQIQHIEMARDIAARFNHIYKNIFTLPEAHMDKELSILKGLDGRKMSKSYNNTIPLFLPEKKLKKAINKIKTNLQEPGEPKDCNNSTVFDIWKAFASVDQIRYMQEQYENGISWGEAKNQLFELINQQLIEPRKRYEYYLNNFSEVDNLLKIGAEKTREKAQILLKDVKTSVGIYP